MQFHKLEMCSSFTLLNRETKPNPRLRPTHFSSSPMASKRSKVDFLQSPPSASPSEQSSSHEDEEESSVDLTPQPKPSAQKPHSSSGSDSEPEDTPLASKPGAPKPAVAKRPAETRREKTKSKKAKRGKGDVSVEKSTLRVWSEEEVIAILKGMIDYREKIGFDPSLDMEAFHAFIKKSLHAGASRSQLYDKVRHLKRKYWDNVEKLNIDGSVSSSWKAHEKKLFDLSKKIWRSEGNGMLSPKSVRRTEKIANPSGSKPNANLPPRKLEMSPTPLVDGAKDVQEMDCEKNLAPVVNLVEGHLFDRKLGSVDVESYVMEKGLDLINVQQRAELKERWANLRQAELKVFVERTKLILDQAKLVLAAQK